MSAPWYAFVMEQAVLTSPPAETTLLTPTVPENARIENPVAQTPESIRTPSIKIPPWKKDALISLRLYRTDPTEAFLHMKAISQKMEDQKKSSRRIDPPTSTTNTPELHTATTYGENIPWKMRTVEELEGIRVNPRVANTSTDTLPITTEPTETPTPPVPDITQAEALRPPPPLPPPLEATIASDEPIVIPEPAVVVAQAVTSPVETTEAPTHPQPETTSAQTSYNQEQIERLRASSAKMQKNTSFAKTTPPTTPLTQPTFSLTEPARRPVVGGVREGVAELNEHLEQEEEAELAQLEDALLGAELAPATLDTSSTRLQTFVDVLAEATWHDSIRPSTTPPRTTTLAEEMDTPINPYGAFEERKDKAVQEPTPETAPTEAVENMEPAQVLTGTPTDEAINSANLKIPVASEPIPSLITEATTVRAPAPEKPPGNWFTRLFRGDSSAQQTTDAPKAPPATSWERPSLVGKPPPPEPSFHA